MENLKLILRRAAILLFVSCFFTVAFAADTSVTPVGYWRTKDDRVTDEAWRSIVQITQDAQGNLNGKIIKANYRTGEGPDDVCKKCTGSLHNQKIIGLPIMWGLHQSTHDTNKWMDGQIVDPVNGMTYRCTITVLNSSQIAVRGYLGFSIFGRTQIWTRVSENSVTSAMQSIGATRV